MLQTLQGKQKYQVTDVVVEKIKLSRLLVGSITSCCSGKEPALLPETRHERAAEIEPSLLVQHYMNLK